MNEDAAKPFHVTAYQVARAIHEHEDFACPLRHKGLVSRDDCTRFQRLVPQMASVLERATEKPLVSYPFARAYARADDEERQALPPVAGQVSLDDVFGVWA